MSVRDEIRHEIETVFAFEGEKPLKIIGHSLGGALGLGFWTVFTVFFWLVWYYLKKNLFLVRLNVSGRIFLGTFAFIRTFFVDKTPSDGDRRRRLKILSKMFI